MSETKNKYLISEMRDEDNPEFVFSLTNTKLLVDIATKKLDVVMKAKKELSNRGIGKNGKFVGPDVAAKQWGI